ncbi:MAG: hypothetical protein ACYCRH_09685 [Acidiferrobacteraceae bacterium]
MDGEHGSTQPPDFLFILEKSLATTLGCEFLRQALKLNAFPVSRPALLKPLTRVERTDGLMAVPKHVSPTTDDPLAYVLFALKHEGADLQVLAEALPRIDPGTLLAELCCSPSGVYIRCEQFMGAPLTDLPEIVRTNT